MTNEGVRVRATAAKIEAIAALLRAGPAGRAGLTAADCELVIEISGDVAAMSETLPGDAARASRDAVHLLLIHACPSLRPQLRAELATAVAEVVARPVVRRPA